MYLLAVICQVSPSPFPVRTNLDAMSSIIWRCSLCDSSLILRDCIASSEGLVSNCYEIKTAFYKWLSRGLCFKLSLFLFLHVFVYWVKQISQQIIVEAASHFVKHHYNMYDLPLQYCICFYIFKSLWWSFCIFENSSSLSFKGWNVVAVFTDVRRFRWLKILWDAYEHLLIPFW